MFRKRIDLTRKRPSPEVRWFLPRVREARAEALVELTRVLDAALNNTSQILLFEAGKGRLLFPGDAQIESWSYPLFETKDRNAVRAALAETTLYKVGHHGSLNATPTTLWDLFQRRGPKGKPGRLVTVLSTEKGHHGSETKGTEVPRKTLLAALSAESDVYSTEGKPRKDLCVKVDGELE